MLKNIEAVIFDLDGSLVDSMWIWKDIDVIYLKKFGHDLPDDLQSCLEGKSFTETAIYIKERFQIPDSIEEMKKEWNQMAWDKYSNEVNLKPGVPNFLSYCKEQGIKLGIATSNSRELVNQIVEVLNLDDYFQCVMTSCDVAKGKPAPDIYLAVAKQLQVKPEHCLVFEDIVPGIMAGKAAGMSVCAVDDLYSIAYVEEKKAVADYYIHHFDEVLQFSHDL